MAAAGNLGGALRRSASILELARNFWSVDRKFKDLLLHLEKITAIPGEDLAGLVADLKRLRSTVNSLLDTAFSRGYGNRALTGGSIHSIRERNELLADFIERCELGLSQDLDKALECAAAEFMHGETVSADVLF